jgi:hypothetical protein
MTCEDAAGNAATCGGGWTTRTRTVIQAAVHGGKACPSPDQRKACNVQKCDNQKQCHTQHVKCDVKFVQYGRQTTCTPNNPNCHQCSTAYECNIKHIVRTISVKHDKRFMHIDAKFKCRMEADAANPYHYGINEAENATHNDGLYADHSHDHCVCRCDKHPTGCYKKNYMLTDVVNPYIHGNVFENIPDVNKCSNLCNLHDFCTVWEYMTSYKHWAWTSPKSNVCILRTGGTPRYVPNPEPLQRTTYAGVKSGTNGCVQERKVVMCPMGKYKWTDNNIDKDYCSVCPTGKYTWNSNEATCTEHAGFSFANVGQDASNSEMPSQYLDMFPTHPDTSEDDEDDVRSQNYQDYISGTDTATSAAAAAP